MKLKSRATFAASLIAAACMFAAGSAYAGATIFNTAGGAGTSTIALGMNDDGSLNTTVGSVAVNTPGFTGLAYKFPDGSYRDATAPGCQCEGWGVSTSTGAHSGFANVSTDGGPNNLTFAGIVAGVTTAVSSVTLTSLPGLAVTHSAAPSAAAPGALFEVKVKITNSTGGALSDVKYVRVMDWDVPLTEFAEFVTIGGTATTTLLERSHDNGFNTANPLGGDSSIIAATEDVDFVDSGPTDHGAYFRFNFGTIAAGESFEFSIFYGATGTESAAFAAMTAAGIELYSLGQSSPPSGDPTLGTPATFIFGFKGVGGVALPTPGSLALVGLALLGAGALRRRQA